MAVTAVNNFLHPLLGQPQAVQLLTRAITCDRVAGGYLFCGPGGVGKALAARQFAQQLLKDSHPQPLDLLWLEPTFKKGDRLYTQAQATTENLPQTGLPQVRLEQIRTCSRFLASRPSCAPRKVVVIDSAVTMAEAAANSLLKTLEEPGGGVVILLADQLHRLLPTIRSRCQLIPFYRLPDVLLMQIVQVDASAELVAMAQGSPGELLKILHQAHNLPTGLLDSFFPWPRQPLPMLQLAQAIDAQLDLPAQIWLVDYLQQRLWQEQNQCTRPQLLSLEDLRHQLSHYAQPRLAWEVALLKTLRNN